MFFKTVVISIDEGSSGRDAIAAARYVPFARRLLVSTYPYSPTPGGPRHEEYAQVLRQGTLEMLEARRVAAGLGEVTLEAIADTSPAEGIKRFAVREHADLLILGSAGNAPAGRIRLGDVCHGVLHGASCPVLVAPRGFSEHTHRPERIGLAYDGSPESGRVLDYAAELARAAGTWLDIVQAVDLSGLPELPDRDHRARVEHLLGAAQARLDDLVAGLDVPACGHVVEGPVQTVLGALGDRVDLLLCGSRSWGPATRISLGGIAERLMQHVACPVLVVPRVAELPLGVRDDAVRPVPDRTGHGPTIGATRA